MTKKRQYSETSCERSHDIYVTKKNYIWDLKMGGDIGGGGGERRGGIGRDNCNIQISGCVHHGIFLDCI